MKKLLVTLTALVAVFMASGCTENARVKAYGGTAVVQVPPGQKLIDVTWKDGSQIWYLTRPMQSNEFPETFSFREKSSFGMIEGTMVFQESR